MEFIDLKSQYQAARDAINGRIQTVLDHGQYIMGPEVAELEERLAAYTGARHCITVASGTEALLIALMAGVPARQIGWMSRFGERLPLRLQGGEAVCPHSGDVYVVRDGVCALLPSTKKQS
jgi:cystathionine beta-lyase/cystathionine gamma-synthase